MLPINNFSKVLQDILENHSEKRNDYRIIFLKQKSGSFTNIQGKNPLSSNDLNRLVVELKNCNISATRISNPPFYEGYSLESIKIKVTSVGIQRRVIGTYNPLHSNSKSENK